MSLHLFPASENSLSRFPNKVSYRLKRASNQIMVHLELFRLTEKKIVGVQRRLKVFSLFISKLGPWKSNTYTILISESTEETKDAMLSINLGTRLCYLNVETPVSIVPSAQSAVSHHHLRHVNQRPDG
jgi:hypothetical protein